MLGKTLFFLLATTPAAFGARTDSLVLTLNLPSYELEVWDGGERIRSYPVTIGDRDYPTPTGGFQITRIEWNPRWVPPPSPWAKGEKEKEPGKGNPMGRVKLQFDDYLYIHGTWSTKQIGGAYSHGCVRLRNEDALDLARLLATRMGALPQKEIAALERNSRRTRSVRLPEPVPLRIRYGLTEEKDGELIEHEDPYGWSTAGDGATGSRAAMGGTRAR